MSKNKIVFHYYFEHRLEPHNLDDNLNELEAINKAFELYKKNYKDGIYPQHLSVNDKKYDTYEILDLWKKHDFINVDDFKKMKSFMDNPKTLDSSYI